MRPPCCPHFAETILCPCLPAPSIALKWSERSPTTGNTTGVEGLSFSPADISWGDDTLVQPDLFVADITEWTGKAWSDLRTLHLVVELLSPSSLRADRFTKRRLYQEQRIPTYWVVDIEQKQVEEWTPDAIFPVWCAIPWWRHLATSTDYVIDQKTLFTGIG